MSRNRVWNYFGRINHVVLVLSAPSKGTSPTGRRGSLNSKGLRDERNAHACMWDRALVSERHGQKSTAEGTKHRYLWNRFHFDPPPPPSTHWPRARNGKDGIGINCKSLFTMECAGDLCTCTVRLEESNQAAMVDDRRGISKSISGHIR